MNTVLSTIAEAVQKDFCNPSPPKRQPDGYEVEGYINVRTRPGGGASYTIVSWIFSTRDAAQEFYEATKPMQRKIYQ